MRRWRRIEESARVSSFRLARWRVTAAAGFEASQWVGFLPRQDAARFGVRLIKQDISAHPGVPDRVLFSPFPQPSSSSSSSFAGFACPHLVAAALSPLPLVGLFSDPGLLGTDFSRAHLLNNVSPSSRSSLFRRFSCTGLSDLFPSSVS